MRQDEWTEQAVKKRFDDAWRTLRKLPSVKGQGYSNAWPEIVRSPMEVACTEPKPMRVLATPKEIAQLDQTLGWLTWVSIDERKLIWRRAQRVCWKKICREFGGCDRTRLWRCWKVALLKVALRLNFETIQKEREAL